MHVLNWRIGQYSLASIALWLVSACAFFALTLTLIFFSKWIVETQGVWADGQITSIHYCTSRGVTLSTVALEISYADGSGHRQSGEASCEHDDYAVGQTIPIRYLSSFPWRVLTREDIGGGFGRPLLLSVVATLATLPWPVWWILREIRSDRAQRIADEQFRMRQRANPQIGRTIRSKQRRARRHR